MASLIEKLQEIEEAARKLRTLLTEVGVLTGGAAVPVPPTTPPPAPPPPVIPPVPPPAPPPAPPVTKPPAAPTVAADTPWPGEDSAVLNAVIKAEAESVGIHPATLKAVEVWETGHYRSPLFRAAWNVGGVKYRPDLPNLGHVNGYYQATDGNRYAKYPSWQAGIRAHARFFLQPLYTKARATNDPVAQVLAIHNAGYAEHSQEWLAGVTALAKKYTPLFAGVASAPAPLPATHLSANFTREEAERSDVATQKGISNTLPEALVPNARKVAGFLEVVRGLIGRPFRPNSWYRSPGLNAALALAGYRPSATSKHLQAIAVDLPRTQDFWEAITEAMRQRPQDRVRLLIEDSPPHLHIELDSPYGPIIETRDGAALKPWERVGAP